MYHTIHFKRLWFEIISNTFHVGWHLSLQIHRILSPDCVSAWNYEIIFHLNEIFISNRSQTILTHFLNIVHWHCQYNNTFYSPFNSSVTRAFLSTFHDNFLYPHNFFVHCFDQIRFQSIGSQEIFNLFEQVALLHEAHCTTKKKKNSTYCMGSYCAGMFVYTETNTNAVIVNVCHIFCLFIFLFHFYCSVGLLFHRRKWFVSIWKMELQWQAQTQKK